MRRLYKLFAMRIFTVLFISFTACSFFACESSRQATSQKGPEPAGWYAGDMHVHRNCGTDSVVDVQQLAKMMEVNDLAVISVLADMGNGEVLYSKKDLSKVNGQPAPESVNGRLVNWDVEWHWDATYSQFEKQALGGHLVLLGLQNAQQIWEESPYKVLDWGKKQGAVSGFAHMEYLNDSIQNKLNCCIPVDYPVEAAMETIDFVSEDVFGAGSPNGGNYFADGAINAYYKLLNCGFRISLVAGTDYPCNNYEPLGTVLTYVQVPGNKELTYSKWVEGIAKGRTVVSRNAHNEFLDLKVNGTEGPGAEINIAKGEELTISVNWSANQNLSGPLEIVSNGKVIATQEATADKGNSEGITHKQVFNESGWICARRMGNGGHMVHTSPVYVTIDHQPVRASAADADFFIRWIDNILHNIQPGGEWNRFFPNDYESVSDRYNRAKQIYQQIKKEASSKSSS